MSPKDAKKYKTDLSIRLMELGNLIIASIIVNQLLERNKSLLLIIGGSIIGVLPYLVGYLIRK
ncbi:hypothetical protein A3D80_02395 [Candidatus Roizmanbacteria bacterium RIFCSPHIGHO2_02_FULL_40_13b]|nr:MAG: hypothetical protein A3D80_02395 [Candidatus Roizmanbacteria bacterium RIFCSPHIGHO2_02_FULL_40_13b]